MATVSRWRSASPAEGTAYDARNSAHVSKGGRGMRSRGVMVRGTRHAPRRRRREVPAALPVRRSDEVGVRGERHEGVEDDDDPLPRLPRLPRLKKLPRLPRLSSHRRVVVA